jgi:hypothetical protein
VGQFSPSSGSIQFFFGGHENPQLLRMTLAGNGGGSGIGA